MKKTLIFTTVLTFYFGFAQGFVNNRTDTTNVQTTKTLKDTTNTDENKEKVTNIRLGRFLNVDIINDGDDIILKRKNKQQNYNNENHEYLNSHDDDDNSWFHKRNFQPHWAGFSLGLNNYLGADFNSSIPKNAEGLKVNTNKSLEVNLNLFQIGLPIVKHRLGLVSGLGFKWNNYKFRNTQIRLHSDSSYLYYSIDTTNNYVKSKLTVSYIHVPLLLEFQIPINNDEFYFATGIEAGLKLEAHTKMKTNNKKKYKDKNDFHVSPYTISTILRLGYGSFGLYASYSWQSLFQKNEGPELYPYSIGFTLNF